MIQQGDIVFHSKLPLGQGLVTVAHYYYRVKWSRHPTEQSHYASHLRKTTRSLHIPRGMTMIEPGWWIPTNTQPEDHLSISSPYLCHLICRAISELHNCYPLKTQAPSLGVIVETTLSSTLHSLNECSPCLSFMAGLWPYLKADLKHRITLEAHELVQHWTSD